MKGQVKEGLTTEESLEAACRCLCNCDACSKSVAEEAKKSGK